MRKLALQVDDLAVQSFVAGAGGVRAGTVHAHGPTAACPTGSPLTCPETEWWSCGIVCLPTLETNPCNC
jgi:hypothetical protein